MTWIIVIIIVALLVLWGISVQNKLVQSDELCKNALKQINVQQVSRYDAIAALVKLTREYASYEADTLQKVIEQRKITTSANPTVADINANEAALREMSAKLIAIAEQYPELKANETFIKTMSSVDNYTNQVRMSQMVYNDSVTNYNRLIRQFPDSIVASLFHFVQRDYLQVNEAKSEIPSMKL